MSARLTPPQEDLYSKLKWLMFMRVALVTFLFGVTILVSLRSPRNEVISSFTSLYFLIGYAYLLTGLSAFFFQHIRRPVRFAYLQIAGDIILITGLLHITGGIESPFVFLYFLSIISGSLLCYQKGGVTAALLSSFSYLVLLYINTWGHAFFHVTRTTFDPLQMYYRTFLNLFSFFVIAFLSNQLAHRLKKAGEEIQAKESNIEDLQAFNENIIQSVSSGLITTDLSGRITSVNRSAEKILKLPQSSLLQMNLEELFSFEKVTHYLHRDVLQGAQEDFRRFEVTYTNHDKEEMILGMTLSLLRNNRKELQGYLCTFQDLTRIKALEDKMKRNEQLAMIGELSAGIAHEIRNPLASMSGSIQMLKEELDLDDANQRLMEIILKETDRLNNLIGNFLMYARPKPIERERVRLKELIDETLTLLQFNRRILKTHTIDVDLQEELELDVDSTAMRQVLWNLAVNAVDAMPDGGRLTISCRKITGDRPLAKGKEGTSMVRITFSDTGNGIDPRIQKRIFFPFHTTKQGGTGLGLAIVHQIMQQHEGWIDVVSLPGQGATFHLYLPEKVPAVVLQEV